MGTSRTRSIDDVLAWTPDELRRIRLLLALRRHWLQTLYPCLRGQASENVGRKPLPNMVTADRVLSELPARAGFLWQDRYIQLRLWEEVGRMVDARLADDPDLLAPQDDDLGSLHTDPTFAHPEYYTAHDVHRQSGGIWQDDRGALVYAMGARVVHVNSRHPFALHEGLVADIPVAQPSRVLDLGCGFGKTTFFLKDRWPDAEVHGIDVSAPVLRLGRRMATERGHAIEWRQASAEALPFDSDTFDVLTFSMVLHELPLPAVEAVLKEASRVLRPGGVLVGLEARLTGDAMRDLLGAYHSEITGEPFINEFRDQDFGALAGAAGYAEVDVREWHVPGAPRDVDPAVAWATPWALLVARKEA